MLKPQRRRLIYGVVIPLAAVSLIAVTALVVSRGRGSRRERELAAAKAMEKGDLEKARILLSRLVSEVPEDLDARHGLLQCLLRLQRIPEASSLAEETLRIAPDFAPAHAALAFAARRAGDMDRAVSEARLATEGSQVSRDAGRALVDTLLDAGLTTEALSRLTRMVEAGSGGEGTGLLLAAFLREHPVEGMAGARARQALSAALAAAGRALSRDPLDEATLRRYGGLALAAGRPLDAATAIEKARDRRGLTSGETLLYVRALAAGGLTRRGAKILRDWEASAPNAAGGASARALALAWLAVGRPHRALEVIQERLDRRSPDVSLIRLEVGILRDALLASTTGREALAERLEATSTRLLALRSRDELGRASRAMARLTRGRATEAIADALALEGTAPHSPTAAWLHGLAVLQSGYPRSALPLLRRGRAGAGDPRAAARWIVRAALAAGNPVVAREESAGLTGPKDTALLAAVAVLLGEPDRASALARGPGFATSPAPDRVSAALALAAVGRPTVARLLADELETGAKTPLDRLRLGDLRHALGEEDPALRAWEEAAKGEGPAAIRAALRLGARPGRAGEVAQSLRGRPGGETPARITEGREALAGGDAGAARKAADDVLSRVPESPDALCLRLTALRASGAPPGELLRAAERVLAVLPDHLPARRTRALVMAERARSVLGAGPLEGEPSPGSEAVGLDPGAGRLPGLSVSGFRDPAALEADARLLAATPGRERIGTLLLGFVQLLRDLPGEAATTLRHATAEENPLPESLAALTLALLAEGRAEEALPAVERYERLRPASLTALELRARVLAASGRGEDGVALVRNAMRKDGDQPALHILLGHLLLAAGRAREAVAEADAAEPGGEAAILLRARARGVLGDRDGEIKELRDAVRLAPESALAHELLGSRLLGAGDTRSGREHLEKAAELAPGHSRPRLLLALLAEREHRTSTARELYEQVLSLTPADPVAANNLAMHLLSSPATVKRAVELARTAMRREPDNAEYRDTLAAALLAAGDREGAVREAREALRLAPRGARIAVRAARVLRDAGRLEEARRAAESALRRGRDDERDRIRAAVRDLGLGSSPR